MVEQNKETSSTDSQKIAGSFLKTAIKPTLEKIEMWSHSAEKLLLMTACHESGGFRYRKQIGGPALSYFQMEPNTLDDLYDNYLVYRPDKQAQLDQFLPEGMDKYEALENNDSYACAATRLQYYREPRVIPNEHDDIAMSEYCKTVWNTDQGKATAEQYYDDYLRYKPEGYS